MLSDLPLSVRSRRWIGLHAVVAGAIHLGLAYVLVDGCGPTVDAEMNGQTVEHPSAASVEMETEHEEVRLAFPGGSAHAPGHVFGCGSCPALKRCGACSSCLARSSTCLLA